MGSRIFLGTVDRRAIQRAPQSMMMYIMTFATSTVPMMAWTASGFWRKSKGPGIKPWKINAPSNTAPITLPGIPKAINGINAPPTVALLADSDATIPSSLPFPNSSGCLDARFAET